jgi:hypothetical protein
MTRFHVLPLSWKPREKPILPRVVNPLAAPTTEAPQRRSTERLFDAGDSADLRVLTGEISELEVRPKMGFAAKIARRCERKEPTSTAYLRDTSRGRRRRRSRMHADLQPKATFRPDL